MAIIGRRFLWNELIVETIPTASEDQAISGLSLIIDLSVAAINPFNVRWIAQIDDLISDAFVTPAVSAICEVKLNINSLAESGATLMLRTLFSEPLLSGPPLWGFFLDWAVAGGSEVIILTRFVNGSPSQIFSTALSGSQAMLRLQSDDDGANVRVRLDIWNGSTFVNLFYASYNDMAGLIGDVHKVAISGFAVSGGTQMPTDIAVIDNITIDELAIVVP